MLKTILAGTALIAMVLCVLAIATGTAAAAFSTAWPYGVAAIVLLAAGAAD